MASIPIVVVDRHTSLICSNVNDPARSCLFAKTSNVAPASRYGEHLSTMEM